MARETVPPEETARWTRHFAVECDSGAWRLAEAEEREIFDATFRAVPAPA